MKPSEILKFKKSDIELKAFFLEGISKEEKDKFAEAINKSRIFLKMGIDYATKRKVAYDFAENCAYYIDSEEKDSDGEKEKLTPTNFSEGFGYKVGKEFFTIEFLNIASAKIKKQHMSINTAVRELIEQLSESSIKVIDDKIYTQNKYLYIMFFYFLNQAKKFTIMINTEDMNKDTVCVMVNLLNNANSPSISDHSVKINHNNIVISKKRFDKTYQERFIGFDKKPKIFLV